MIRIYVTTTIIKYRFRDYGLSWKQAGIQNTRNPSSDKNWKLNYPFLIGVIMIGMLFLFYKTDFSAI